MFFPYIFLCLTFELSGAKNSEAVLRPLAWIICYEMLLLVYGACHLVNKFTVLLYVEQYSSIFSLYRFKMQLYFAIAEPFPHLRDTYNIGDGYFMTQIQAKWTDQPFCEQMRFYRQRSSAQNNHYATIGAGQPSPDTLHWLGSCMVFEKQHFITIHMFLIIFHNLNSVAEKPGYDPFFSEV